MSCWLMIQTRCGRRVTVGRGLGHRFYRMLASVLSPVAMHFSRHVCNLRVPRTQASRGWSNDEEFRRACMKVVILCGGLGTRLREETEFRPKPMVEIGGRPILWHIMKIYAHSGFREFVLCLGYRGNMIKEYFLNYEAMNNDFTICLGRESHIRYNGLHTEQGFEVTLAETGPTTMTGGRLQRVRKYVDTDTFMLTYGDGVADLNIADL